jgi:hypothetical protein
MKIDYLYRADQTVHAINSELDGTSFQWAYFVLFPAAKNYH